MKKFLLACVFPLSIMGCKTAHFTPSSQNSRLLPVLEPQMDLMSFETVYSVGGTSSSSSAVAGNYGNIALGEGRNNSVIYRDPRVQAAKRFFESEVRGKIANRIGERYGYAVCRINQHVSSLNLALTYLCTFTTLNTVNLLGVPFGNAKGYASLSVEILDSKKNVIGIYEADCFEKYPIALYWGYGQNKAQSLADVNPFITAMNHIKTQIANDYDKLNNQLLKAGPISN